MGWMVSSSHNYAKRIGLNEILTSQTRGGSVCERCRRAKASTLDVENASCMALTLSSVLEVCNGLTDCCLSSSLYESLLAGLSTSLTYAVPRRFLGLQYFSDWRFLI
jgi:hypothetical protein